MGKSESTKPFTTVADAANYKKDALVTAFTDQHYRWKFGE
jgi:hypothetical protein